MSDDERVCGRCGGGGDVVTINDASTFNIHRDDCVPVLKAALAAMTAERDSITKVANDLRQARNDAIEERDAALAQAEKYRVGESEAMLVLESTEHKLTAALRLASNSESDRKYWQDRATTAEDLRNEMGSLLSEREQQQDAALEELAALTAENKRLREEVLALAKDDGNGTACWCQFNTRWGRVSHRPTCEAVRAALSAPVPEVGK